MFFRYSIYFFPEILCLKHLRPLKNVLWEIFCNQTLYCCIRQTILYEDQFFSPHLNIKISYEKKLEKLSNYRLKRFHENNLDLQKYVCTKNSTKLIVLDGFFMKKSTTSVK